MLADRLAKGHILFGDRGGMGEACRAAFRREAKPRDAGASTAIAHCKLTAVGRVAARRAHAVSRFASEGSAFMASAKP